MTRSEKTKEIHHLARIKKWPELGDKAWLEEQYVAKGLSQREIGSLIGCSKVPVATALTYHDIPRRTNRSDHINSCNSGDKVWNWRGGIYNGKIVGFTGSNNQRIKLRNTVIRERGEVCEWCKGVGGTSSGKNEVHHIRPFRFVKEHVMGDLLILCGECHRAADNLFRELAGQYFVDNGSPELYNKLNELRESRSNQAG